MFFRKKKSKFVVTERTPDTKEFTIPEIEEKVERKGYQKDHFVSPIFGTNVTDKVVIPNPVKRTGDLDKQLDDFRTTPRLSKEEKKDRYGSEYHEFDLVQGRNLNEAMERKRRRLEDKNDYSNEETYVSGVVEEVPVYQEPKPKPKTNLNDFFNPEVKKPVMKTKEETRQEEVKVEPKKPLNIFQKEYRFPSLNLLNKPVKRVQDNGTKRSRFVGFD